MRILVTNDDGIHGPGLHALARALDAAGHDVLVVAPDRNHSGYSAALGDVGAGDLPYIETTPAEIPGAPHIEAHALSGPPALCVMAARLGGYGDPPEAVASGINPGANTGRAVLHSGTVGGALTAANFGISGMAVSVAGTDRHPFATAAAVAVAAAGWLEGAPPRTVLNVNVPDREEHELRGTRWADLAPFGTVRATLSPGGPGRLDFSLVETSVELPPESDSALVRAGYVAVTCLRGITAAEWEPVAADIDRRLAQGAGRRGRSQEESA